MLSSLGLIYLAVAASAAPECKNKDIPSDVVDQWVKFGYQQMGNDEGMVKMASEKADCQFNCFDNVFRESIEILIGKFATKTADGYDIGDDDADVVVRALVGTTRACFPGVDRDAAKSMMTNLVKNASPDKGEGADVKPKGKCPNGPGPEENSFLHQMHQVLPGVMKKVAKNDPDLDKFFDDNVFDCQQKCLFKNMDESFQLMYRMDKLDDSAESDKFGKDSFTGALASCLPGIDHEKIVKMVNLVDEASKSDRLRLYDASTRVKATTQVVNTNILMGAAGLLVAAGLIFVVMRTRRRTLAPADLDSELENVLE